MIGTQMDAKNIDVLQGTLDLTARGQRQLEADTENWERISSVIRRVLRLAPGVRS